MPGATQESDKFHLIKKLQDDISKYIIRKYPKNLILSEVKEIKIEDLDSHESEKDRIREEKIAAKWVLMTEIKKNIKMVLVYDNYLGNIQWLEIQLKIFSCSGAYLL